MNRGALWAKANILRCEQLAAQGWCFVNDPTRSNNSVGRDTAWFSFGSDYVTPHFSKDALLWYVEHLREDGLVFEFFDIRSGKAEDYGLNVNDDSPLILIALWHHYCVTGEVAFLQRCYANAVRVAEFLLSQRDERGLVCCRADGTGTRGIVGWRNIIPGYRLSGATTELNSECFAALRTVAAMATELGFAKDAARFRSEADALRAAINEHLLDRKRNLYYLTIDEQGRKRTNVTCDLVFPVLFGVAEHDVATNIIATLSKAEFWTEAGLHTVPRNDIEYGPESGYGLLGGVWGGPTFWFAAAAAPYNPAFMVFALAAVFRHYAEDPRRYNTVPGQFSEWLHGEMLTNQGMMLSPWFAPKYLWTALEGAAGLRVTTTPPTLEPHLPGRWQWMGVKNVMVRGKSVSWFTIRDRDLVTYASYDFPTVTHDRRYDEDVSVDIRVSGESASHVALARPGHVAILIGNTLDRTITISLQVAPKRLPARCTVRWYNSLAGEWKEDPLCDVERLRNGFAVHIARHGYCVVEFSEA